MNLHLHQLIELGMIILPIAAALYFTIGNLEP